MAKGDVDTAIVDFYEEKQKNHEEISILKSSIEHYIALRDGLESKKKLHQINSAGLVEVEELFKKKQILMIASLNFLKKCSDGLQEQLEHLTMIREDIIVRADKQCASARCLYEQQETLNSSFYQDKLSQVREKIKKEAKMRLFNFEGKLKSETRKIRNDFIETSLSHLSNSFLNEVKSSIAKTNELLNNYIKDESVHHEAYNNEIAKVNGSLCRLNELFDDFSKFESAIQDEKQQIAELMKVKKTLAEKSNKECLLMVCIEDIFISLFDCFKLIESMSSRIKLAFNRDVMEFTEEIKQIKGLNREKRDLIDSNEMLISSLEKECKSLSSHDREARKGLFLSCMDQQKVILNILKSEWKLKEETCFRVNNTGSCVDSIENMANTLFVSINHIEIQMSNAETMFLDNEFSLLKIYADDLLKQNEDLINEKQKHRESKIHFMNCLEHEIKQHNKLKEYRAQAAEMTNKIKSLNCNLVDIQNQLKASVEEKNSLIAELKSCTKDKDHALKKCRELENKFFDIVEKINS